MNLKTPWGKSAPGGLSLWFDALAVAVDVAAIAADVVNAGKAVAQEALIGAVLPAGAKKQNAGRLRSGRSVGCLLVDQHRRGIGGLAVGPGLKV